jgi:hypothetical protein
VIDVWPAGKSREQPEMVRELAGGALITLVLALK